MREKKKERKKKEGKKKKRERKRLARNPSNLVAQLLVVFSDGTGGCTVFLIFSRVLLLALLDVQLLRANRSLQAFVSKLSGAHMAPRISSILLSLGS